MPFPRLFAATALALSAAASAQAATGSGSINFTFLGFEGPFAASDETLIGDPALWQLTGRVNGQLPALNGVTSPSFPGFVYLGGTLPLSGQSVTMVYDNVPGAIASLVSFTPASFTSVSTGQPFRLGTLSFTNGQWVGGTDDPQLNYPVSLRFRLSTSSSTPEFNQVIEDTLVVATNQSAGDCGTLAEQQDEADFIFLASRRELGAMRVYDQNCGPPGATNTGAVELWGRFGSLEYVDFRNPTGSAFLTPGVGAGPIGGPIPEPGTWAVMLAGFGLAGAMLRRRRAAWAHA